MILFYVYEDGTNKYVTTLTYNILDVPNYIERLMLQMEYLSKKLNTRLYWRYTEYE